MKACVLEKPYDVRIKELPIPEPKDDEVLLRVTVAGICTNDVRDYKRLQIYVSAYWRA